MTTCHDLQLWWELPSIAHFCSLFRAAFDLLDFDIEDLEAAILTDGFDGSGSPLLVELLVRLLQGCLPGRNVTPSNIDSCLRKLFRQKCHDKSSKNLLPEGDFRSVSLRRKVEILHALCDLRLEAEDVLDLLKNLETESLRVEPLGYDDNGATYWYFYGTRLYREDQSYCHPFRKRPKEREVKRKKRTRKRSEDTDDDEEPSPVWQVECFTEEDWRNLVYRFESCESRLERGLLQTLQNDFLPEIPRLFEEKEKRRMMEFTSRRSSGRVQKLKEKKEEEERRLAKVVGHNKKRGPLVGQRKKLEEEEETAEENDTSFDKEDSFEELLHLLPVEGRKERKKRKSGSHREVHRKSDWEEDVLQERNLSPQPPAEPVHKHKPYKRKEPKNHIRNHGHSKKSHRSRRATVEEVQAVSDTSNKENNGGQENFSEDDTCVDFPEDSDKPKVFTGRKTNNSLSSIAFSLTPSTVVPEAASHLVNNSIMKKRVKSKHLLLQTEDELRTGMYKILEHLGDHDDAWPFLESVDENIAPNYYAVIRRPMYIAKMEQRLDSGFYASISMFEADFKLMMDNCKLYNGPDSDYTHMAFTLEKIFSKLKEKYLEAEFSSDDEICIDMSFDQSFKKKRKLSHPKVNEESEVKKRGRKKKKVGRKPKHASPADLPRDSSRSIKRKSGRPKKIEQSSVEDESNQNEEIKSFSDSSRLENSHEDVDDFDEPMLIVREDPYCQEEESNEAGYNYQNGANLSQVLSENENSGVEQDTNKKKRRKSCKPDDQNDSMIDEEKASYFADKILKGRRKHRKEHANKKENNHKKAESPTRATSPLEEVNSKQSESDVDSDQDAVLLYYNNDPQFPEGGSNEWEDIDKEIKPTDDIDHQKYESPSKKHSSKTVSREKKKRRSQLKNHHHHRHRHHHKNRDKGKESKHHKRKTKHSEKESTTKKVLRVDDVYDYSDDENIPKIASEDVQPELLPTADERSVSPSKKKKARRKTRHHKSAKHKTEKVEKTTKTSRRKKVPPQKMAAIEALSEVTEQTLKDITTLLDDPKVPKFNEDDMIINGAPDPSATEYDFIAAKIEKDYRKKLQLDAVDEKKPRKRKKSKVDNEQGPPRKNRKKEPKLESITDIKCDTPTLDNAKELFKDIKDGRIKPGAIIKSKDIAKKEGQVKKDPKAATEGKVKAKQNPFGKINKQENTKLTSLIAKAKESRVGLVPNSEVGNSSRLSLGSILQFGEIGSSKHSNGEDKSPLEDDEEKQSDKYEIPYDNRREKPELKDDSSQSNVEEEEKKVELDEDCQESSDDLVEELTQPSTPYGLEFKQDKVTPNLSAWFRAFGRPKVELSPRKKMNGRMDEDDYLDGETECYGEEIDVCKDDDEQINVVDDNVIAVSSDSVPGETTCTTRPSSKNGSPEPPSPVKPPDTPWFHKEDDKLEDEPLWKKNKTEEDEDPYKFEEEELDRAREEAKKQEVERQRKASVSSSGLSDPSPLNIDSDRSPAAFSSEGERSPMTHSSPATRSPMTPGFGGVKQFSPVTEKSPGVTAYSPRYETPLAKGFVSNQTNGPLKVGFYQDLSDKSSQEKKDGVKNLDINNKESPIYSPTVPYVSTFYSSKDAGIGKQKSPGRFGSFYSSVDALDKPKTPHYYSASDPSTPSDKPSSVEGQNASEEKHKNQFSYYNYDPTKPLTDQYKNTGSAPKTFYCDNINQSPSCPSSLLSMGPAATPLGMPANKCVVKDKCDLHPPKKRSNVHKTQGSADIELSSGERRRDDKWTTKSDISQLSHDSRPESFQPLAGNLANLSQVVSKISQPNLDIGKMLPDGQRAYSNSQNSTSKTVHHNSSPYNPSMLADLQQSAIGSRTSISRSAQIDHNVVPDLAIHQQVIAPPQLSPHLLGKEMANLPIPDHQSLSHLHPPVAHQKSSDADRPGSRNMPPPHHSSDKPLSYLHQKTMWTSSLPSSITNSLPVNPSSISSLVTNATMASFALSGQKSFGSLPSDHFTQLGVDRATLASFTGRNGQNSSNLFSHDILQRPSQSSTAINSASLTAGHNGTNGTTHRSVGSSSTNSNSSASSSSSGSTSNNFDLGLARSYASIMNASQASPLLGRGGDAALSRSLSGSSSPFLPQSPGLGSSLVMPGSTRAPTPAHQPGFTGSISRDPRDPISQSHPSLQIPSLNSIGSGQVQTLNHLNAANLAYSSRDSLALMNQGGRGHLVGPAGGLVDPSTQHLYTQFIQRQHQLAQEELLLRSAGAHGPLAAHQSMMIQQGLMSAAGYPAGYPHSLGLRSGSFQGMNRPWI